MVYGEWQSAPVHRHETPALAQAEATRLALAHKKTFYVLRAIAKVAPVAETITTTL